MANVKRLIGLLAVLFAALMLSGCGSLARQFEAERRYKFDKTVASGNLKKMESILAKKPEWVNRDKDSNMRGTPLGIAASRGDKEVVEFLIAKGADINDRKRRWRG